MPPEGREPWCARSGALLCERYRVIAELGRGGMGAVYRALDTVAERTVALKVLEDESAEAARLFEREYRCLASLEHPSVIEVFDFGITEEGKRFYTMELLEGGDLYSLSPVPWRKLCEYLRDVATSLLLLHARRLVHRDVSPRNVRIDAHGRAKLLDFGALASFGPAAEIVGTAACTAPEVLHREPLDQRTDLFSLGATGYWALTKRKPYAINQFLDAASAWTAAPLPPSRLVPEIPKALEVLLLSLLSLDPAGRPASAAEVIDRLGAIAELDGEVLAGVADSHLLSCELVGREREQTQLKQHLDRTLRGQGGVIVIEGAPGSGRTRLVSEVAVQARIAGLTTICVETKLHREAPGAFGALTRAVLDAAPITARRALANYPALHAALDHDGQQNRATAQVSPTDFIGSREKRALLSSAFVSWVLDLADQRPLLLTIDDAHLTDPLATGALIGLAHAARRTRILLLATISTAAHGSPSAEHLVRVGARMKLRGLELCAVERLIESTMGDVPHRTRLCRWLYDTSGGNPSQVLVLLSNLIARGIVRFENGAWVLPATLSDEALPGSISDVLSERITQLSPGALRLAQLLALHRGAVSEPLFHRLVPDGALPLLEELATRQIAVGSAGELRFPHERLRPLLLERAATEESSRLHAVLGEALLAEVDVDPARDLSQASTNQLCRTLQAGWHLLHGGEDARGRELLRRAGLELTQRGEGFAEIVPALEASLQAYHARGRSRYERGHLLIPLTLAGNWMDWRLSYKYGDELFVILADATGIALARKLARYLPRKLALGLALAFAVVSQKLSSRGRITRSFRESLLMLIGLASATLGTCATLLDHARARRLLVLLEPMRWFPADHPVRLTHELQIALADCAAGRYAECLVRARRVLDKLRKPGGLPGIPESARQQIEMGVLVLAGNLECYRLDGSVQRTLIELDAMNTATTREAAVGIRTNYHASRGEHGQLERFREEMDVLAAQGGSTWRPDVLVPRNLWWSYALCEDVLGLKRMVGQLQRLAQDHPGLASTRDAAHACYLAERGMATQALERYEAMFEAAIREPSAVAMRFVGAYARILRLTGHAERAAAMCEAALRQNEASLDFQCLSHSTRLELALATAESGRAGDALAALLALANAQQAHDNPLIHGLTHKTIARVALMQADEATFTIHLRRMQDWFEKAENAALLAQCQRLVAEGRAAGLHEGDGEQFFNDTATTESVEAAAAFSACRGPAERLQTALDLVVQHTQAAYGYLYVREADGLKFAAPAVGYEPPDELQQALSARMREFCDDQGETEIVTSSKSELSSSLQVDGSTFRALPLTTMSNGELVVIAVVALVQGAEPLEPLRAALARELARGIYDSGDVRTVYFNERP